MGIKVVDSHRMTPAGVGAILWRSVLAGALVGYGWQPLSGVPIFLILSPWPVINYARCITDRQWHRAFSDRWSHTVVIDVRDASKR